MTGKDPWGHVWGDGLAVLLLSVWPSEQVARGMMRTVYVQRANAWQMRRPDAGRMRGQRVADAEEKEGAMLGTAWDLSDYSVSGQ